MQISAPCTPGICRKVTRGRPATTTGAGLPDFSDFSGFSVSAATCTGSTLTTSPTCITSGIFFGVGPRRVQSPRQPPGRQHARLALHLRQQILPVALQPRCVKARNRATEPAKLLVILDQTGAQRAVGGDL